MPSSQKVYGWYVADRSAPSSRDWPERWEEFEIESFIDDGGVGDVHAVKGKRVVAKLFQDSSLAQFDPVHDNMADRLILLVTYADDLKRELDFVTWPERVLYKRPSITKGHRLEGLLGFTMPRLPGGTVPLLRILADPNERKKLTGTNGLSHTLHIALTIAGQLQQMHRHPYKFIFGDLYPNNIHLEAPRLDKVWFIDPDSYQFDYAKGAKGPIRFDVRGLAPGYSSPVSHQAVGRGTSKRLTAEHDAFAFAIILFQLLMAHHDQTKVHPFIFGRTSEDEHIRDRQFVFGNRLRDSKANSRFVPFYMAFPSWLRDAFEQTFAEHQVVSLERWIEMLGDYRRFL